MDVLPLFESDRAKYFTVNMLYTKVLFFSYGISWLIYAFYSLHLYIYDLYDVFVMYVLTIAS